MHTHALISQYAHGCCCHCCYYLFLFCLYANNSTEDLQPLIVTQKETLPPSVTLESSAECSPVFTEMQFSSAEAKEGNRTRERCTYTIHHKRLSVQPRSGGSSFDTDSVSCKETARKERDGDERTEVTAKLIRSKCSERSNKCSEVWRAWQI